MDTVTIQAFAVMDPLAVSTVTAPPGRPQRTRSTGECNRMSKPVVSRLWAKAPMPPSGRRLPPFRALRRQSRALNLSASAAQITGPSQASTVAAQGSSGNWRVTSARETSSLVASIASAAAS